MNKTRKQLLITALLTFFILFLLYVMYYIRCSATTFLYQQF